MSRRPRWTRDEIVEHIAEQLGEDAEDVILFDGLEDAFLGVATRFENGGHQCFAVYSYRRMVKVHTRSGMSREDAVEWLEFNTLGLYAGPGTPAVMHDLD